MFPLKILCAVSSVSGSGKSSLIFELVPTLQKELESKSKWKFFNDKKIQGIEHIEDMVQIDQILLLEKASRSNPATYIEYLMELEKFLRLFQKAKFEAMMLGNLALTLIKDVVINVKVKELLPSLCTFTRCRYDL